MRLFWTFLILVQISFLVWAVLKPFNAAGGPFRHDERLAALKAMGDYPSPETKAALQRELQLNADHIIHQQLAEVGIWIVLFIVVDVAGYHGWRNFKQNYAIKSSSA